MTKLHTVRAHIRRSPKTSRFDTALHRQLMRELGIKPRIRVKAARRVK